MKKSGNNTKNKKNNFIAIRVTTQEQTAWIELAKEKGISVSELIRQKCQATIATSPNSQGEDELPELCEKCSIIRDKLTKQPHWQIDENIIRILQELRRLLRSYYSREINNGKNQGVDSNSMLQL